MEKKYFDNTVVLTTNKEERDAVSNYYGYTWKEGTVDHQDWDSYPCIKLDGTNLRGSRGTYIDVGVTVIFFAEWESEVGLKELYPIY